MKKIKIINFFILFILSHFYIQASGFENYGSRIPFLNSLDTITRDKLNNYDVVSYIIDVKVSDTSLYLAGNTIVIVKIISEDINSLILEMNDSLLVDSVLVNNIKIVNQHSSGYLMINNSTAFIHDSVYFVQIFYSGMPYKSDGNIGIYNKRNAYRDLNFTWTLTEPFYASDWFPCKQVLTDKADSAVIKITVPPGYKAGSNGLLTNIDTLYDGSVKYTWKTHESISYYLISFAVSQYLEYCLYAHPAGINDSILIQNYIYPDSAYFQLNKPDIDQTGKLIEYFSSIFGLYPYAQEKYGHCLVPINGGMENLTMTSLNSFNFDLVSHELAHQWFGNYVTCADWQDLWINEGFASYAEYLAIQGLQSQTNANEWLLEKQRLVMKYPDGSIFVPEYFENDVSRLFNKRLTYDKGALILHMLRYEIGNDSIFFQVLRNFLSTYSDGSATGDAFFDIVKSTTGIDYKWFENQWYYGEGYPIFDIQWEIKGTNLCIVSTETTSCPVTPFFRVKMNFSLNGINDTSYYFPIQDEQVDTFILPLPDGFISLDFDKKGNVLKKVTANSKLGGTLIPKEFFTYWPNPASYYLNLMINQVADTYRIYLTDLSGRQVLIKTITDNKTKLDLTPYGNGMYIISLTNGNDYYSGRILIQKPN